MIEAQKIDITTAPRHCGKPMLGAVPYSEVYLMDCVGIGLVANFLKAKESATAFSGALKDVAHSVVSGMDIQTKATLQTANANNVLLNSTKPLTASQIALRNEIAPLS